MLLFRPRGAVGEMTIDILAEEVILWQQSTDQTEGKIRATAESTCCPFSVYGESFDTNSVFMPPCLRDQ